MQVKTTTVSPHSPPMEKVPHPHKSRIAQASCVIELNGGIAEQIPQYCHQHHQ